MLKRLIIIDRGEFLRILALDLTGKKVVYDDIFYKFQATKNCFIKNTNLLEAREVNG